MTDLVTASKRQELAEGSPGQQSLPSLKSSLRTGIMPALPVTNERAAPAAETGTVEAVAAEGRENIDSQDAMRTTAEQQVSPARQEESTRTMTPSILIIEDSAELAEIIAATLQRLNMTTSHETHGMKAFDRFHELRPDVLLLDIGLPDMTGWKLLESIKEEQGDRKMPKVIVITAYGDPANRLIGKLQNVHDYLIKPFTADEVEKVVLGALNSARA
jgi:CheY-like chemotaxis protein